MTPAQRSVTLGPIGDMVSENVAAYRRSAGLSARELAERIGGVLSRGAISDIERGARRVDVDDLVALAAGLGVTPVDLLAPDEGATINVQGVGPVSAEVFRGWSEGASELRGTETEMHEWLELVRLGERRLREDRLTARAAWEACHALVDEQAALLAAAADDSLDADGRERLKTIVRAVDEATLHALRADQIVANAQSLLESVRATISRRNGDD